MEITARLLGKRWPTVPCQGGTRITFYEILPLASRNWIEPRKPVRAGGACSEQLQLLFDCLRKWEYDDLPCAKFREEYIRCVNKDHVEKQRQKREVQKLGVDEVFASGDQAGGADGTKRKEDLTVTQLNKLMKLYPQPNRGMYPYRPARRLGSTSYAEDTYNKKTWRGKPS